VFFDVQELTDSATSYLLDQTFPHNCCSVCNMATLHNCKLVEDRCLQEIASKFEEVATYEDFLQLDEAALKTVMTRDDLQCTGERGRYM
jgi:hypothetical protein